jgi:hypothetical protein
VAGGQRVVAGQPGAQRVVLLGQQADVVAQLEQAAEHLARPFAAPHHRGALRQPERGGQVAAVRRRHPVHAVPRVPLVPQQHPAAVKRVLDG